MPFAPLTRRQALLLTGGGIAAACSPEHREARAQAADGHCVLMPHSTEGPFYVDPRLERSDIRDGRHGTPLIVRITIQEAADCSPARGARVDLWQCDANGVYSAADRQRGGVDVSRETFLRGHQFTDDKGEVLFRTIWPAWYTGRPPHIHFKVSLESREVLTAQLYFPDERNAAVFAANPAYTRRWVEAARNNRDGIFNLAGGAGVAAVSEADGMFAASLDVGIDRTRRPEVL